MLQSATLKFLRGLSENNNREWFETNRAAYTGALKDFENLLSELLRGAPGADPDLAGQEARQTVFRIYRDVRFSKDKKPYKTHFGAYLSRGGRKWEGAGYYIHIEPGKSFLAGGIWMPSGALLKQVRQEIDYNPEEFNALITAAAFRKSFGALEDHRLKTYPKGYGPDNPAIDHLRQQSFIAAHRFEDAALSDPALPDHCLNLIRLLKPTVDFLNRNL